MIYGVTKFEPRDIMEKNLPADSMSMYLPITLSERSLTCYSNVRFECAGHVPLIIFFASGRLGKARSPLRKLENCLPPEFDLILISCRWQGTIACPFQRLLVNATWEFRKTCLPRCVGFSWIHTGISLSISVVSLSSVTRPVVTPAAIIRC